jgi:hypothetical protein
VWVERVDAASAAAHPDPDHPGAELARALEAAAAATLAAASREADPGAPAGIPVGGGVAAVLPGASPGAVALGLGLAGPVAPGEVDRLEAFFAERGAAPAVDLSPFADPSVFALLGDRGYRARPGGNVLSRALRPEDRLDDPHLPVEEEAAAEACGALLPAALLRAGRAHVVRVGRRVAAVGLLRLEAGVAWLFGDATAEAFRGRGFQVALVRSRLCRCAGLARVAGAEAPPGGACQRNLERAGFRVAYTRLRLSRPGPLRPR